MIWLDRLERRYASLAIPGLLRYVAFLMFVLFVLNHTRMLPYRYTLMYAPLVLQGEVWRLVTFLFIPLATSPIFLLFELLILVMIGDALEAEWGCFKLTVYYLCGGFATIVAAFLMPEVVLGSSFLNLSLFLAFATLFPDYEFLMFFILPVKVKYLAWLSGAWIIYEIAVGSFLTKVFALLSVANYLMFFGPDLFRTMTHNRRTLARRQEFDTACRTEGQARNTCQTCGRTELTHPDLPFRYCTCQVCGPEGKAFCRDHLAAHKSPQQQPCQSDRTIADSSPT